MQYCMHCGNCVHQLSETVAQNSSETDSNRSSATIHTSFFLASFPENLKRAL